jgi:superfamily II DNA/RNA helicase
MTRSTANKAAGALTVVGSPAEAIHSNKSQGQRERALAGFKSGAIRVLVVTDLPLDRRQTNLIPHATAPERAAPSITGRIQTILTPSRRTRVVRC